MVEASFQTEKTLFVRAQFTSNTDRMTSSERLSKDVILPVLIEVD